MYNWVCWLCFLYICVDLFGEQKYIIWILSFRTNFSMVNLGPTLIWLSCLKIYMARDCEAQCAYTILYEKLISFSLLSLDMSLTSVKHNQYNIERELVLFDFLELVYFICSITAIFLALKTS